MVNPKRAFENGKFMKIAIIGGTGLLGSNLLRLYSKQNYHVKSFSREDSENIRKYDNNLVDFYNIKNELNLYFKSWKPDIIINTIAIVNLEKCENNIDEAFRVNCTIARDIASVAKQNNSYFIHISTDHYFNDDILKHNENSKVILLNNYAKTKYQAENEVLKIYSNSLIVRTNIIGFRRRTAKSFFEWLVESLEQDISINLFTNFMTSPISVNELGHILLLCYKKKIFGIYNIASSEVISKYNFGIKVAEKFNYKKDNIHKLEICNNFGGFKRALTLGLNVSKIENDLKIKMPTIDDTLDILYKEYLENEN
jgi:dTDP-4-dehydrorhamnose reductase